MSFEKFKNEVKRILDVKELLAETDMRMSSGAMDSMGATEISFLSEDFLNKQISWEEIETIKTFSDLEKLLESK